VAFTRANNCAVIECVVLLHHHKYLNFRSFLSTCASATTHPKTKQNKTTKQNSHTALTYSNTTTTKHSHKVHSASSLRPNLPTSLSQQPTLKRLHQRTCRHPPALRRSVRQKKLRPTPTPTVLTTIRIPGGLNVESRLRNAISAATALLGPSGVCYATNATDACALRAGKAPESIATMKRSSRAEFRTRKDAGAGSGPSLIQSGRLRAMRGQRAWKSSF
jgi:hypothetical protein